MGKKYFCWNIDDGLEQDKKIVAILRKYGMGATFNLNAGMFGKKQMIGRVGNYGIKDVPLERYKSGFHLMKYHESFRIPKDELAQVYEGFEIASHGFRHENLKKVTKEEARESILQNSNWEKFKRICDKAANAQDVVCCSTAEALGV